MKTSSWISIVILGLAWLAAPACRAPGGGGDGDGAARPAVALDPEQEMALWEELAAPGEGHRRLDPLVGRFHATVRSWLVPEEEPLTFEGTVTNEWILGGRFLRGEFRASMMGEPFEGLSILGYDNADEHYVGFWCDSMSTMLMPVSEGTMSQDGKVLTMKNRWENPLQKIEISTRDVTTIESRDKHVYEMYETGPDGVERKTLEIVYTRIE